jgi:hypothetical protein
MASPCSLLKQTSWYQWYGWWRLKTEGWRVAYWGLRSSGIWSSVGWWVDRTAWSLIARNVSSHSRRRPVSSRVIFRPGTHYPHVTCAHVMLCVQLGCDRRFNIEFYGADSHFCRPAYVTWSRVELWSAYVPARLSDFCCRTHFVRRDVRVERSSDVTSCFQKWMKCLLKKSANGPFYTTPSHQIMEISIW